jgi:hypothetical protein
MKPSPCPRVATGQQIGVGWTPALSVVKALAALAEARKLGGEAVYWLADEDHDRLEVASTVSLQEGRLHRHRFHFQAPDATATGWLPWTPAHQREAEALWGDVPAPREPTLRAHALALGEPLWRRGLRPFSPTDPALRGPIQEELERWRALSLEKALVERARELEAAGIPFGLDPRLQAAWFSLDPATGRRLRLEPGEPCPPGRWLSPGAALRPLMQSLLIPDLQAVVLGPGERAYWRLTEACWDLVGLQAPRIISRPSVYVVPPGLGLEPALLPALREGRWGSFAEVRGDGRLPSTAFEPRPDPGWTKALAERFEREMVRTRSRLEKLDRRHGRDRAGERLGMDPERLRQKLFPLGLPQERVLPGLLWLRREGLLDGMEALLGEGQPIILLEAHHE